MLCTAKHTLPCLTRWDGWVKDYLKGSLYDGITGPLGLEGLTTFPVIIPGNKSMSKIHMHKLRQYNSSCGRHSEVASSTYTSADMRSMLVMRLSMALSCSSREMVTVICFV